MNRNEYISGCVVTLTILIQILAFLLKVTGVIKCSWFITILPLIAFLAFSIGVVSTLLIYAISNKNEEKEK